MKSLEKCISVSEYDLIHAYYLFTDGNYARIISRKYNIPYVVAVRNTDVNVFFKHMIHLRCVGIKILKDARTVFFCRSHINGKFCIRMFLQKYVMK